MLREVEPVTANLHWPELCPSASPSAASARQPELLGAIAGLPNPSMHGDQTIAPRLKKYSLKHP